MTTTKQIQMLMRDMLFINWAVHPEALREMVPPQLELDTKSDSAGNPVAFVSAVCFRVEEVRSNVLPLPRVSFNQVNYRVYVRGGAIPSVCFLDMRLNSRMVSTLTGFLRVPVVYEEIDIIAATEPGSTVLRYKFDSSGLRAEVTVDEHSEATIADPALPSEFFTQRLTGYAGGGANVFKLEVDHPMLIAETARIESVEAPRLEELGVLTRDQSAHPHSALYVRDAVFGTNPPARVW